MKKFFLTGISFIILALIVFLYKENIVGAKNIPEEIKSSAVYAYVPKGAVLYDRIDGKSIDLILSESKVEILQDKSEKWYFVRYKNKTGWVKGVTLLIPKDRSTNTAKLSDEFIEDYANRSFKSETRHFIWVDIDRQYIYVLNKDENKWAIEKRIICATGKNVTPTIRGDFKIGDKGEWFYSERLGSGAKYWVRISGSYLFHSVAMDKEKKIIDGIVGQRRSSGCVRMKVEDAKWFYENIEKGSNVWIY